MDDLNASNESEAQRESSWKEASPEENALNALTAGTCNLPATMIIIDLVFTLQIHIYFLR